MRNFPITKYNNQNCSKNMFAGLISGLNNEQPNKGEQILDMDLIDTVIGKIMKFNIQKESFNTNYPKLDHLQRYYHDLSMNHFVQVITNKYNAVKQPLSIIDLCCGYGQATFILRQRLISNGVEIDKIYGYDVSEDMIKFAQGKNTFFPQVDFQKRNIEKELTEVAEFDVAICFFGLHWMNDLETTIAAIHRSLKSNGVFLSLTPMEINDLIEYRTTFANKSKWSDAMEEQAKVLHPFHKLKEDYLTPLSKYFKTTSEKLKVVKLEYTRQEFIDFLHSWLQEVRHLTNDVPHEMKKEAVANAYISDLIDTIPKDLQGDICIKEDGSVVLNHHTFDYDGQRLDL